ncbi:MAG: glycoside hydrolase family 66 protein [bacterium]
MPAASSNFINIGLAAIEIKTDGDRFTGLGKISIGDTVVRSGRLPLRPFTQSFAGWGLDYLRFIGVEESFDNTRICLEAIFSPSPIKMMRDHSFDPIHEIGDWDQVEIRKGRIDIVITLAADKYGDYNFDGFAYHYEYNSQDVPIFFIYDQASWEIDGDIEGATVYNQSACSSPVVTFEKNTAWSTEGILFFLVEQGNQNPIMTHNLPRWADHQWFDFQFKGDKTLLGVYPRVDLIRSLICRDAGKAELKCFDKHIFDEALSYSTVPKSILLNTNKKTVVDHKNLWTAVYDTTADMARAEYGIKEQPPVPFVGQHHWTNYTIETYYKDIVPACAAVGIRQIFAENFKRSDSAEPQKLLSGNMCTSHEYEIAPEHGGVEKFKEYIDRCHKYNIKNFMWTNTYVSLNAKMNLLQRDERGWYMAMEDTRTKYAGAYTMVSSNLDLKNPDVRRYWIDAHKKIIEETGLDGFYIDSYYNLFFMPVNFKTMHPQTSWRESMWVMKELQDAGVEWMIESFGPFGQPGHGHSDSYDIDNAFICYHVGLGNNAVTVPVPGMETDKNTCHDPAFIYYQLAHKVPCSLPLFIDGKRIDEVYGETHRRVLREYHELLPLMHRRYLQEDGQSVLWHDSEGTTALVWNFTEREAAIPGDVFDITSGQQLPKADAYQLKAMHTYRVTGIANLFFKI